MPTPATIVHRDAVRLLVVDADGRLLLQHCITPDTREEFGCTPGGALHESETPSDAARRELFEETGPQVDIVLDASVWEPDLLARVRALETAVPETDASKSRAR